MFREILLQEHRVYTSSTSKGCQVKYKKGGYWYKEDELGEEGLVEFLVSLILKHSTLSKDEYVLYEMGYINSKAGCRSLDFTDEGNFTYVSLQKLYERITGLKLHKAVNAIETLKDRKDFVLNFFRKYYSIDLSDYFRKVFSLDLITLNEDRHFNNLGVFINRKGVLCNAPIFDNGLSLLNGNRSLSKHLSLEENTKRVTSKPFSGSPLRQYELFGTGFYINYVSLFVELGNIEESLYKKVLKHQLLKYKELFFKYEARHLVYNNTVIGTRLYILGMVYDTKTIIEPTSKTIVNMREEEGYYLSKEETLFNTYKEVEKDILVSIFGTCQGGACN